MNECEECGFVYGDLPASELPAALRAIGDQVAQELRGRPGEVVAERPDAVTWSALEYACHVRDVLLVQRDRLLLTLVEDGPSFQPMYREQRVELLAYAGEVPGDVAEATVVAAGLIARAFELLSDEQLARRCTYNYPAPTEVDVAWLGRHTVHEGRHHLGDIERVLATVEDG